MQHLCSFMYYSSKKSPNKVGPLSSVPPLTTNLGEGAHLIRFSLHIGFPDLETLRVFHVFRWPHLPWKKRWRCSGRRRRFLQRGVVGNSVYLLRSEVWECVGDFLLVTFCNVAIVSLNPVWLSYNALTHHCGGN